MIFPKDVFPLLDEIKMPKDNQGYKTLMMLPEIHVADEYISAVAQTIIENYRQAATEEKKAK